MEEAYSELYQQFLRLRALCLKQAALLQQLMTALHRQQGNVGTFSDLLAMDMSKLCVGGARQIKENQDFEQNIAPLRSLDSLNLQEVSGNLSQADHLSGGRTALAARVGVFAVVFGFLSCSSRPLPSVCPQMPLMDFPSQLDVLLMSDVALQSHVCEFCQAVFPGDTTTRGEFLRHLCTHIT
uniref:TRAF family member-associated NFKB activator n=1 Tax=Mola mola TaxID=94237 RepID=A0A3Q3VRC2_MOLML